MKKRMVIKIGSSSIVNSGKINCEKIIELARGILKIRKEYDILIVSSGAIALGKGKLNIQPKAMKDKQACAAIGQASLINSYEDIFNMYKMPVAQILLSHDDFSDRKRLINLENTIDALFENGVIPIINENDALAIEEIKVGDNDTLAAMVATCADASVLILCSDIDGIYTCNPNTSDEAKFIPYVQDVFKLKVSTEGSSSSEVGTGGMVTKLRAAKMVCSLGCDMIIINSNKVSDLDIALDQKIGSFFKSTNFLSKKQGWVMFNAQIKGKIIVDAGAMDAIRDRKSLLPSGILDVEGDFLAGSVIELCHEGIIFAKGVINYSALEVKIVMGKSSKTCIDLFKCSKPICHANDIVLTEGYYD